MQRKRCGRIVGAHSMKHIYDEILFYEILSRLPIKSLMRFKCVSKRWQSVIQKDQHFIDSHMSRLKNTTTSGSLLLVGKRSFLLTAELVLTSDDHQDGRVVAGVTSTQQIRTPFTFTKHPVCTLDGLICFMDTSNYRARIYNISTRESSPWLKSSIKKDVNSEKALYESSLSLLKHEFGYDPVTKEYKVVALWFLHRCKLETYDDTSVVGEVLTVRKNSWRKIDVVLPDKKLNKVVTSVYMSGSIFWHCERRYISHSPPRTIVAGSYFIEFDVGSEKFRLVDNPPHIEGNSSFFMFNLMEVNGRLARLLVTKMGNCIYQTNMLLLHDNKNIDKDDCEHDKEIINNAVSATSSAAGCRCNYWTEEAVPVTSLKWKPWKNSLESRHVPGTADLFLTRSLDKNDFSLHWFDWKKKSPSHNKIKLDGHSSWMTGKNGRILYYDDFYTFTPTLSPVN